jgi:hypothetical protein
MNGKPSIVFCHGIWADGSCFIKVIPALQAEGHQCIARNHAASHCATGCQKELAAVRPR